MPTQTPNCPVHRTLLWLTAALLALASSLPVLSHANDPPTEPVETALTVDDRDHWSFRPIRCPELPRISNGSRVITPIDQFIIVRLEQAGLQLAPEASRVTLLRRLSFDLTGLPPSPAEIEEFVGDNRSDAYDRLVDRLMASPAYGERWGQHWLDLARFAETDGFEHDLERPNAWRYRDWVIDALNADMPYDEFTRLQLAGDEMHPDDPNAAIATGFLLCGPDMPDINLQEERRHNFLNDMTATVGATLLGLQMGCAQCHDHKYDPISQYDFYRLRACFDPTAIFQDHPLPLPPGTMPPPEPPIAAQIRTIGEEIQKLEEDAKQRLKAENPDLQPTPENLVQALAESDRTRHIALTKELAELKKSFKPPEVAKGRTVAERLADLKPSRLMVRGDFRRPAGEVLPAFVRVANLHEQSIAPPPSEAATSTRRLQLANWIVADENPLAARVIVNRLWQHHFGRGLVESVSDFGKMGNDPTHPDLLDWLATELARQKYHLKAMHRLIVRSAVYRQSSRPPNSTGDSSSDQAISNWRRAKAIDPENKLLARRTPMRLEGEAIRDAMLTTANRLHNGRGGPGVRPPLPAEVTATLLANQWKVSPVEEDHRRRSIYLFVRRNLRFPLFEAFDRPDANVSCPRRNRSTIAPQALILLNSEFSLDMARHLAGELLRQEPINTDRMIDVAYRRVLGRGATVAEIRVGTEFLDQQSQALKASGRAASELALPPESPPSIDPYRVVATVDYCLALFNLNEFVYVE